MARLLGTEKHGNTIDRYWLHSEGAEDRITVETVQDVEPVFDEVKRRAQKPARDFHYKASIPSVVISEISKVNATQWGVSVREAFSELVQAKTDRSQKVWKMLTEGRDYRRLQAKAYR